jgi:UDP-N-acetylmuramate dehydrogenase
MNPDFSPLQARFGEDFSPQEALARYTAARLGGPADGLVRVQQPVDLIWAAQWAQSQALPWIILGGGANVLISDRGFRGLVIINTAKQESLSAESGIIEAESGAALIVLARHGMAAGLKGLEWAVNVPGTLGGAVINNAGAHGGDMAHNLLEARVFDLEKNAEQTWAVEAFEYAYRHSKLKGQRGRYLVLSARLQLEKGHIPAALQAIAEGFIAQRKKTQPPGASLGSMFKNPPGDYAGRLIEAAGLKGQQRGGVQISPLHGNFFINVGGGSAADYDALITLTQRTVHEKFGIHLELEVEKVGDWEG